MHSGGVWDNWCCCRFVSRTWLVVWDDETISKMKFQFRICAEYRNIGILFSNLNIPAKIILETSWRIPAIMWSKLRYSWSIRGKGTCCRFVSCYFWLLVARGSLPSPPHKSVKLPLRWGPLRGCGQPNQLQQQWWPMVVHCHAWICFLWYN